MLSLVYIKWADSVGAGSSWSPLEESNAEPFHCYSVGWLVRESETALVLAPHLHPSDDSRNIIAGMCGEMVIPKSAVIVRKTIKSLSVSIDAKVC